MLRDRKFVEMESPAIANRFAYTFLQQLLFYPEEAQEHMLELGTTPRVMGASWVGFI